MPKRKKPQTAKPIPRFKSEDEERAFWAGHEILDYFDASRAVKASFPNLRPTSAHISLRIPVMMLEELKARANAQDVPYQSLLKVYLAERLASERKRKASA